MGTADTFVIEKRKSVDVDKSVIWIIYILMMYLYTKLQLNMCISRVNEWKLNQDRMMEKGHSFRPSHLMAESPQPSYGGGTKTCLGQW